MMILGELGGIYSAIVSIPSFLISYFVQNMFMNAVTEVMPLKEESSLYHDNTIIDKLGKKKAERENEPVILSAEDV